MSTPPEDLLLDPVPCEEHPLCDGLAGVAVLVDDTWQAWCRDCADQRAAKCHYCDDMWWSEHTAPLSLECDKCRAQLDAEAAIPTPTNGDQR